MPYSDFTKQEYSDQDFLRLIEQRIRKEIRAHHLLDPKKTYSLDNPQSVQGQVLTHFLTQIFQDRLTLSQEGIVLTTEYLELYVSSRLQIFLEGKDPDVLKQTSLSPLRSITVHELREVAKLLDIDGDISFQEHELIESLHKKYPQTKPSMVKSFLHMEQLDG